ncbi:Hsp20/alpha crystallin family protein [Porticoccus sp.]|uniref:Hsp20/alpha crystallin family protein n=1 Tax=Porticoccus sp. TaxID=2024853 RepID=UPI003F69B029
MSLIPRTRGSFFDMDRFFEDFWAPARSSEVDTPGSFFSPRVDILDKSDHYEITAEMPGIKKEDIKITLENGVLRLEAETTQEKKEEKEGKVIRQERRYGRYVRSFDLGGDMHEEDIKASFKDGVLKLTAPKLAKTEPEQKRIKIK